MTTTSPCNIELDIRTASEAQRVIMSVHTIFLSPPSVIFDHLFRIFDRAETQVPNIFQ